MIRTTNNINDADMGLVVGSSTGDVHNNFLTLDVENKADTNDHFLLMKHMNTNVIKYDGFIRDHTTGIIHFKKDMIFDNTHALTSASDTEIQIGKINNTNFRTPETDDQQYIITGKSFYRLGHHILKTI